MDPTTMPELPMEAQITITRLFDASREKVFAYLTDAEHLKEWWGPEGFSVSEARSDARAGGEFFLMMQGPDDMGGPVNGEYVEVVPPEVVAMTSWVLGEDGERILESHERMTLTDVGGKTELVLEATGKALQPFAAAMLSGMRAGWNQSFQILDEVLRGVTDRQIVTDAHVRGRARGDRLRCVHGRSAHRRVVRSGWVHPHDPRDGRSARRPLAVRDARTRRHRLRQPRGL